MQRRRSQHRPAGRADRSHLHSLVATRIVQRRLGGINPNLQNSAVSVVMWVCAAVPAVAAVAWHGQTDRLMAAAATFFLLYHLLYRRLTRL